MEDVKSDISRSKSFTNPQHAPSTANFTRQQDRHAGSGEGIREEADPADDAGTLRTTTLEWWRHAGRIRTETRGDSGMCPRGPRRSMRQR